MDRCARRHIWATGTAAATAAATEAAMLRALRRPQASAAARSLATMSPAKVHSTSFVKHKQTLTTSATPLRPATGSPARLDQRRHTAELAPQKSARPRTAMFFPGMLGPWFDAFPRTCKPFFEQVDDIVGFKLSELIETGRNDTLTETTNAQPAIMATSIMILRVLEAEFGFKTAERLDVTLGHSLGEYAALVAGGYLHFEDALWLVKVRAEAMADAASKAREEEGGPVGMVALICEASRLDSLIDAIHEFTGYGGETSDSSELPPVERVLIANVNSKNQVVVSGSIARIQTLLTNLREFGGHDPRAVQLKSDTPFHSPLMQPGAAATRRLLGKPRAADGGDLIEWPALMPCISNVTARPFRSRDDLKDLLARQCVETVRWWDSIRFLDQQWRVRRWIGIGPGKVGRNLVGKEVGMKGAVKGGGVWSVHDPREVEAIMKSLEETEQYADEDEAVKDAGKQA